MDKDCIEITKDIVTVVVSGIAAYVAIAGLSAWRQQLKGKSEYDLARRLLIAVYKIRNAINIVRDPFKPAGEIYTALKENGYEEKDFVDKNRNVDIRKIDGRAIDKAVYVNRWKVVDEATSSFDIEFLEAEAMWGAKIEEVVKGFLKCRADLYIAIRLLIEIDKRDGDNMATINRYNNDENDLYGKKLTLEIKKIEDYLRNYLK